VYRRRRIAQRGSSGCVFSIFLGAFQYTGIALGVPPKWIIPGRLWKLRPLRVTGGARLVHASRRLLRCRKSVRTKVGAEIGATAAETRILPIVCTNFSLD